MSTNTPTESAEREKFEAWCVKNRLRTDRLASPSGLTDVYLDSDVDWMWEGWKGRAALLPPVVAGSGPAHADSVEASSGAAAALGLPQEIAAIARRLHTQDNRITQDPLFAVQQKRRVYGVDSGYCDNAEWVLDGETFTPEDDGVIPHAARRVGYIDKWEFVTGCFTEQGCKDFIAINGHNLHEPRIYAYGSYRNAEFIALRAWLMSLVPAPLAPQAAAAGRSPQPNEQGS